MRTISTKIDAKLHDQFMELCNRDGKCQSEFLRDVIETLCEDCSDEDNEENQLPTTQNLEIKVEDMPEEPRVITHGKILDDNGNIVGTF